MKRSDSHRIGFCCFFFFLSRSTSVPYSTVRRLMTVADVNPAMSTEA